MRALQAVICSILIFHGGLEAQDQLKETQGHLKTMDEVRQWSVDVPKGSLTLTLSSYAHSGKPDDTVLRVHLTPVSESVASCDLVAPIAEVLKQMPKLGYDPARLVMISTPLQESEYKDGVNRAVQESGVWKQKGCIGAKYCHSAEPVVKRYLESASAYNDLDSTFAAVGLQRLKIFADDVACSKEAGTTIRVGCDGLIFIVTAPVHR